MNDSTTLTSGVNWFQLVNPDEFNDKRYHGRCVDEYLTPLARMEEQIRQGESEIKNDDNLSEKGKQRGMQTLAAGTLEKMAEKLRIEAEGYERGLNSHYKELYAQEPAPDSTDARSASREAEIRAYFRDKPAAEVLQALQDAESNGDYETIRALENAPRSLAPEPYEQIQKMRFERLKRKYPEATAKIEDMEKSHEKLKVMLNSLDGRLKQIR